jgi:hypothetical protein
MPTIESELRDVLHAYASKDEPSVDRRSAVGRRIARRQRRHHVLAAMATIVVIGGGLTIAGVTAGHRTTPSPATSAAPDRTPADPTAQPGPGLLPEYAVGGRLVASARDPHPGGNGTGELSLSFTPTDWNFRLAVSCHDDAGTTWNATVNGRAVGAWACDRAGGVDTLDDSAWSPTYWKSRGVGLGEPVTISAKRVNDLIIVPGQQRVLDPVSSIGVYEAVPYASYPFPPQPTRRAAIQLPDTREGKLVATFTDEPTALAIGHAATFAIGRRVEVEAGANGPGQLSIYVGQKQIYECDSWNWSHACGGTFLTVGTDLPGITPGQKVKVTVVARNFTVPNAWKVIVKTE